MKTIKFKLFALCFYLVFTSFTIGKNSTKLIQKLQVENSPSIKNVQGQRVSFWIKGTGSKNKNVSIGIGEKVGSGSCCTTITPSGTNSVTGNVGDVVYDSDTKRVIVKIYADLQGTTIDLKDYY